MFKAHASVADLEALLSKRYLYQFENGVIVIKHWRMANALRKDRYTPTAFQEELKRLNVKENGAYTMSVAERLPDGCQMVAERLPQDRLGKDRLDKVREGENREGDSKEETRPPKPKKHCYGEYKHVRLTDDEYNRLCDEFGEVKTLTAINKVDAYCQETGKTYKDYNLTIRRWGFDNKSTVAKKNTKEIDWENV